MQSLKWVQPGETLCNHKQMNTVQVKRSSIAHVSLQGWQKETSLPG